MSKSPQNENMIKKLISTADAGRQTEAALRQKWTQVSARLQNAYGTPSWRQALPPVDELVSTILSQSTSDTNRDKGFNALKARYATWEAVRDASPGEVVETIRPAGLANQKGPRIQQALKTVSDRVGSLDLGFLNELPIEDAKKWLTSIDGVGPKTAAIILCFAFNRAAFPVDTHVHRISSRLGFFAASVSADKAHPIMEAIVPPDEYYSGHLNLIRHGREICHARNPECERCPLTDLCDFYQAARTTTPVNTKAPGKRNK
jgi:endonuclease-3